MQEGRDSIINLFYFAQFQRQNDGLNIIVLVLNSFLSSLTGHQYCTEVFALF